MYAQVKMFTVLLRNKSHVYACNKRSPSPEELTFLGLTIYTVSITRIMNDARWCETHVLDRTW
jgi:hypothetical protein